MSKAITTAIMGLLAFGVFATLSACEEEHRTTKIIDRDRDDDWRYDRDRHYDRDDYRYDHDRDWRP